MAAGSQQGIRAGRAYVELGVHSKLQGGLAKASARLRRFGSHVRDIGRELAGLAAGLALPLGLSARLVAGFDDEMAKVRAVTGATAEEFRRLNDLAKELGRTTSFTAAQVAAAMVELGRAGFKPQAIEDATGAILDLARGTDTELPRAAEIAAAALRGFGLSSDKTRQVADLLTSAANNSAQTLSDLGESMKYIAPIANEAGDSIVDAAAALGILANNGIKGSMAGTAVARAYKNLATSKARQELASMGVAVEDTAGNLRSLADILTDLGQATKGLGSARRLALFETLFGRGQAAALKLASPTADLKDMQRILQAAGGTAARTAKQMDETLGGAWRKLKSAAEGLGIAVGDQLKGALAAAADRIREWIGPLTEWVSRNRQAIVTVLKWAGVLGAAGIGLLALGKTATIAGRALGVLAATMKFMAAHPVVALLAGLAALAAAADSLTRYSARISDVAGKTLEISDKRRAATLQQMERLQELGRAEKLNNDQMAEAQRLIKSLTARYGDLGLAVDQTTGKITGLTGAQAKLSAAMRKAAVMEVEARLAEVRHNIEELRKERESISGSLLAQLGSVLTGDPYGGQKKVKAITARQEVLFKQRAALSQRLRALGRGEREALNGGREPPPLPKPLDLGGRRANGAPVGAADSQEYLDRVHRLKLQQIEDEEKRAIALLKHRYEAEIRQAREAGKKTALIEQARDLELAAIHNRFANQRQREDERRQAETARNQADLDQEIGRLQIEATKDGIERRRALLDLEERQELARARELGVSVEKIREKYGLKRAILDASEALPDMARRSVDVRGTFHAAAAAALAGGDVQDRIAEATRQTARNTKDLVRKADAEGLVITP